MIAMVRAVVFGALLSFVGAAVPADNAPVSEVTVTAPRPPTAQELAGEAVPNFVKSHSTPSRVLGQLTRWRTPVCPWAEGLGDAMDNFLTARIRAVAATVGAPHDESAKCKPNVIILFTLEPQKLVNVLLKQDSQLLGFHYATETKRIAVFDHPIQGWYVTSTRNFRGMQSVDDALPLGVQQGSVGSPTGAIAPQKRPPGEPGSRLDNFVSSEVTFATILVDVNKIKGMTIGSISDYIAVLALTQARMTEGCSQLPSIMDLMSEGCAAEKKPDQVTAGDLAYLRSLYSANLETPVEIERSNIENSMVREFEGRR